MDKVKDKEENKKGDMPVRVRFAPSPTGHLHLGGARTALYNWLFARGMGGRFILRIEDTDLKRSEEGFTEEILKDLQWLGMDWDEGPGRGGPFGPYLQSQRGEVYRSLCQRLVAAQKAYHCFCTQEALEKRRQEAEASGGTFRYDGRCRGLEKAEVEKRLASGEPSAVRFKVPHDGNTAFRDIIRKRVVVQHKELDDFIIVRSDGTPTYNLTVVADDLQMRISHVIRGDDHISNTPKQILIYNALEEPAPAYAHIPMILGPDGKRLSKRHGATAIGAYRDMGFLPEAMVNYLALLGWSYDDRQTIFSMNGLIERFSLEGVSKKAAIFDDQKLIWMNGTYIRDLDTDRLVELCTPYLRRAFGDNTAEDRKRREVLQAVQGRMKLLTDCVDLTGYFWPADIDYQPDAVEKLTQGPDMIDMMKALQERFSMVKSFKSEGLEEICRDLVSQLGIKLGVLVHPLRAAVTGRTASPGIFEILEILGKEKVLYRLDKAIEFVKKG